MSTDAVFLNMHHLTEQVLIVLRSREDAKQIAEETGVMGPDSERLQDVQRIVGRDYALAEWHSLDLEPGDESVAKTFCWGGETPIVPFFRVTYRGLTYSSIEMGLGEFSVHLLFWILEQFRDAKDLVLLLDEPDAYLPPVGVSALISRLLRLCRERDWSVVLTTHSEELIQQAVLNESFIRLNLDNDGDISSTHVLENDRAAESLLTRPPVESIIFCEDETALYLTRALLDATNRRFSRSTSLVWGNGFGYMEKVRPHLPRSPRPDVRFAFMMDGDKQRDVSESDDDQWPVLFLPIADPDEALRSLLDYEEDLVDAVPLDSETARETLASLEGQDAHDWVDGLAVGDRRGRTLQSLADLWCEKNQEAVEAFQDGTLSALLSL